MDKDKIELKIIGITKTAFHSGAHALILTEADGPHYIPIVISASEAYPIAMAMERISPPRPLTVDLFVAMAHGFGIKLKEVFIYKFEDGVFYSELTFTDGERTLKVDGRTSDAAAIITRTDAPIYTTQEVINDTGFLPEVMEKSEAAKKDEPRKPKLENYAIEELEKELERLTREEKYEEAGVIAALIEKKKKKK